MDILSRTSREHPKNILVTVNGKSRNGNHKNDSIDNSEEENAEWYGIKSPYSPRQVKELTSFVSDSVELIRNIKFRKIRNTFWENLNQKIK